MENGQEVRKSQAIELGERLVKYCSMYLMIQSAPGFVLVNLIYSFKAHYEFSAVHGKILQCMINPLSKETKERDLEHEKMKVKILQALIRSINDRNFTFIVSVMLHLAAMSCSTLTIGAVLAFFNVLVFFTKLYRFHAFMIMNPNEEFHAYLMDSGMQRDALVVSCLSLFLELFGHIFIQILSCMSYYTYVMQPTLLQLAMLFTLASDVGRKEIGMRFGRFKFARHITPQMRCEGAILAILTPLFLAYLLNFSKWKLSPIADLKFSPS